VRAAARRHLLRVPAVRYELAIAVDVVHARPMWSTGRSLSVSSGASVGAGVGVEAGAGSASRWARVTARRARWCRPARRSPACSRIRRRRPRRTGPRPLRPSVSRSVSSPPSRAAQRRRLSHVRERRSRRTRRAPNAAQREEIVRISAISCVRFSSGAARWREGHRVPRPHRVLLVRERQHDLALQDERELVARLGVGMVPALAARTEDRDHRLQLVARPHGSERLDVGVGPGAVQAAAVAWTHDQGLSPHLGGGEELAQP